MNRVTQLCINAAMILACACSSSIVYSQAAHTDRTLVHEGIINAPVEQVWKMFVTDEGAQRWMAPRVQIDLRVGGTIRTSYHPESTLDDEHTIINRILAYEPNRMLAIRNEQAPMNFEHAALFKQAWSITYFEPLGAAQTRLRMVGLGYGEGPQWDVLFDHFQAGNAYLISLLQAEFSDDNASDETPAEKDASATFPPRHTSIAAEVVVNASLKDVWHAWTTTEGLRGFLVQQSNVTLAPGGAYELYFLPDAPDGARGSEGCSVLSYLPGEMFSFTWNAPPQFTNVRDMHTWVVLRFEKVDAGVRVRLDHDGFDALKRAHPAHAEEIDAAHAYFDRIWPHVLDSLKRRFDEGPRWDADGRDRW